MKTIQEFEAKLNDRLVREDSPYRVEAIEMSLGDGIPFPHFTIVSAEEPRHVLLQTGSVGELVAELELD